MQRHTMLVPDAQSAGRPAILRPAVARGFIVWSVWAAVTYNAFLFIWRHGRNLPFFEDILIVPVMTGQQPLSWKWATTQHNEHFLVVPKLILAGMLRLIPDFRVGLYLNAALMSAAAASMLLLVRRLRGSTHLADAVLPLSIVNIGQCECFLIGFALNLVMTAWISCAMIGAIIRTPRVPSWWSCLQIGGFIALLPLCGGSGLALLPPILVWFVGYVSFGWWSDRTPGPLGRAVGVGLLMATSAVVTWYLLNYTRPSYIPAAPSFNSIWATTLQTLSLIISPSSWDHWMAAGYAVLLLTAVTISRLGYVAWCSRAERPRAIGLCAIAISLLIVAFSVGLSRSGTGSDAGLLSRYNTIIAPLLCVLYVAWLLYGPETARRVIHIGLLALVCGGIPAQMNRAQAIGKARCRMYTRIERGLRDGVPTSRLLDLASPGLFPERDVLYDSFKMLKLARVGNFRYMVDDGLAAKQDELRVIR